MTTRPVTSGRTTAAQASSRKASMRRANVNKTSPSCVGITLLGLRTKSGLPSAVSSVLICMLTADCERWTTSAARLMFPVSATATIIVRTSRSSVFIGIRKIDRYHQYYAIFLEIVIMHSAEKEPVYERANRPSNACSPGIVLCDRPIRHLRPLCGLRFRRATAFRARLALRLPLLEQSNRFSFEAFPLHLGQPQPLLASRRGQHSRRIWLGDACRRTR